MTFGYACLSQQELFDLTLAVAQGQLSLEEAIERFERAVW